MKTTAHRILILLSAIAAAGSAAWSDPNADGEDPVSPVKTRLPWHARAEVAAGQASRALTAVAEGSPEDLKARGRSLAQPEINALPEPFRRRLDSAARGAAALVYPKVAPATVVVQNAHGYPARAHTPDRAPHRFACRTHRNESARAGIARLC